MRTRTPTLLLLLALASVPAHGEKFAPVTDEERQLTAVPGQPEAPAVVLFNRGKLDIMDYPSEVSSIFEVEVRLKILSEEGLEYAKVEIPHSRAYRLKDFEGRTVLPDGREVPLPKDAIFQEVSSRAEKVYVTKAAFPAAQVGAILDYKYTLRWDSLFSLEPWVFNDELYTLYSEITYDIPGDMAIQPWGRQMGTDQMQSELKRSAGGRSVRVWMSDLEPVPDEPLAAPAGDLSNRIMMVPQSIFFSGQQVALLESWKTACDLFDQQGFGAFRNKDRKAKKEAAALTSGKPSLRAKVDAVYAFVRDEIKNEPSWTVLAIDAERGVDKVLDDGSGTDTEKALLLVAMLDALKVKPEPKMVWAASRWQGQPDLSVANPLWFDRALVRLEIDGEPLYLDPGDRGLAPGHLPPYLEGTEALVYDPKHPETITLPETSSADTLRQARARLTLDEEGRLAGEGSLILTGHHAWSFLRWKDDPEELAEAWQEWLADRWDGFEVSEVEVEEKIDEQTVRVGFALLQHEEGVLGDESSLTAARPLGPIDQPFTLPPERRRTPVQLRYADRDELTLELAWPEGWTLDAAPDEVRVDNPTGLFETKVEVDDAARTLTFHRTFDTRQHSLNGRQLYSAIRELYGTAEKSDAQEVVLVLD